MNRRKKKKKKESPILELNMTAMCDVVFQLLIYLILTAKPIDVFANLEVNRPTPDPNRPKQVEKDQNLLEIGVFLDGYQLQGTPLNLERLDGIMRKLADKSKTQTVLIKCAPDSPHDRLIKVLDLCAKYQLTNLSVMSL
jgi:biopolymer transport protein ExbD